MAMNKKEQAEMQELKQALVHAKAFRFTPQVLPDLPAPAWGGKTSGWQFNVYNKIAEQAWSDSIAHGDGPGCSQRRGASQGSRSLYSTEFLALQAMRNVLEQKFARELAEVDVRIAQAAEKDEA